ncbi:unnamed protein product [Amoebophrya sp. A25]|nr:unnamed protein product [Amoebophrya sp. A25]|eukprot:GSA25T00019764001.1
MNNIKQEQEMSSSAAASSSRGPSAHGPVRGKAKAKASLEQRLKRNTKNVRKNVEVRNDGGKLPPGWIDKIEQCFLGKKDQHNIDGTSSRPRPDEAPLVVSLDGVIQNEDAPDLQAGEELQAGPVDRKIRTIVEAITREIEERFKLPTSRKQAVMRVVKRLSASSDLQKKLLSSEVPVSSVLLEESSQEDSSRIDGEEGAGLGGGIGASTGTRNSKLSAASSGLDSTEKTIMDEKTRLKDTVPCPACENGRALRTYGKVPAGKMAREYIRYECLDCGRVTQVNE